jgi:hypothetical protein
MNSLIVRNRAVATDVIRYQQAPPVVSAVAFITVILAPALMRSPSPVEE